MDVGRVPVYVRTCALSTRSVLTRSLLKAGLRLTTSNSFALSLAGTCAQGTSQFIRAFMVKSRRLRCTTSECRKTSTFSNLITAYLKRLVCLVLLFAACKPHGFLYAELCSGSTAWARDRSIASALPPGAILVPSHCHFLDAPLQLCIGDSLFCQSSCQIAYTVSLARYTSVDLTHPSSN
jgi:hypothetical protein